MDYEYSRALNVQVEGVTTYSEALPPPRSAVVCG